RGRRVPRRNRTLLRLEELETRTVLSPSSVALALHTASGLGGGIGVSLLQVSPVATTASHGHAFGLADAPGIAKHLVSQPGGTDPSPVTPTVPDTPTGTIPGSNLVSNPSDPTSNLTQPTIPGQASSQTTSSGTNMS